MTTAAFKSSALRLTMITLIAAATVFRLYYPFVANPMDSLWSDTARHWSAAANALTPEPLTAIDPLGFQLFLSAVAKITLGDRTAIAICFGLLSAITPYVWYRFSREALPGKTAALSVWLVLALLPSWITVYSYFLTETLFLPLVGAALWSTWRAFRVNSLASMGWTVALWMCACITRASALPLACMCVAWLIYHHSARTKAFLLSAGIAAAIMVPAGFHGKQILNTWTPFGFPLPHQIYWASGAEDVHITFDGKDGRRYYYFRSPSLQEMPLAPFSDWKVHRQGSVQIYAMAMNGSRDWRNKLAQEWPSPRRLLSLWWENAVLMTFSKSWPEQDPNLLMQRLTMMSRWLWFPQLVLLVSAFTVELRRHRLLAFLPMFILICWSSQVLLPGAVIDGRYRKPLEGLTVVGAVWAIGRLQARNNESPQSGQGAAA